MCIYCHVPICKSCTDWFILHKHKTTCPCQFCSKLSGSVPFATGLPFMAMTLCLGARPATLGHQEIYGVSTLDPKTIYNLDKLRVYICIYIYTYIRGTMLSGTSYIYFVLAPRLQADWWSQYSHSWSWLATWSCDLNFSKPGKPRWSHLGMASTRTRRLGIASTKNPKSGIDTATELAAVIGAWNTVQALYKNSSYKKMRGCIFLPHIRFTKYIYI